jgi:tetratricopeptide (TPR) repeat protein
MLFLLRVVVALSCCVWLAATSWAEEAPADRAFVPPNRWALVVGAGKYVNYTPLKYAPKDARAFADSLQREYSFPEDNLQLLTDDAAAAEDRPTVANIHRKLDAILADKKLDKGDLFIFYFAGHGQGLPSGDYLLPTDIAKGAAEKSGLPVRSIIERIVKAGLKNVLVIADACREGKENDFGFELQRLGRSANIAVLLGCAPGTRSYEYDDLKHGIFTYQLLRSLKKRELRDGISGALWASNVAGDVSSEVFAYTERDFGDAAQKPSAWTEKTQDVLLGAYVPDKLGLAGVKAFTAEAAKLDPKLYSSALATYAYELYDAQKLTEAIEVLKTLEGLGDMPDYSRYILGMTLDDMGRTTEANRVFDKLIAQPGESYLKYIVTLMHSSGAVSPAARLEAARKLWALEPSWVTGSFVWTTYKAIGSTSQKIAFLDEFVKSGKLTGRRLEFILAEKAVAEGRWEAAVRHYQTALKTFGIVPSDNNLRLATYPILQKLGREAEIDALFSEALKEADSGFVHLLAASRAKSNGQTAKLEELLVKAFDFRLEPEHLLFALRVAGIRGVLIADKVVAQADKYPYAWKALLAKGLAEGLKQNVEGGKGFSFQAFKYSDDEPRVAFESLQILSTMLSEGETMGVIPSEAVSQYLYVLSGMYIGLAGEFGMRPELWEMLVEVGLKSERNAQVLQLFKTHVLKGPLDPRLTGLAAVVAVSAGDFALADKLFKTGLFLPEDQNDAAWEYAATLAYRGRMADAATAMARLPSPSGPLANIYRGLRAWVLAATGKKKEAEKLLTGYSTALPVEREYKGLALAALGRWAEAMPLLGEAKATYSWFYGRVRYAALSKYRERLIANKDQAELTALTHYIALTQGDNPLYSAFAYTSAPAVKDYAGETTFKAVLIDDEGDTSQGQMRLTVTGAGSATITFTQGEKTLGTLTGKVDANGNLRGTGKWLNQNLRVLAKIAPAKLYKTYPGFATQGQAIVLQAKSGARWVLLGLIQ